MCEHRRCEWSFGGNAYKLCAADARGASMRSPDPRGASMDHSTMLPTAAAASGEAFFRSATSTLANYQLTGVRGPLFPDMHVQIPARIIYIMGFKFTQPVVADALRSYETAHRDAVRVTTWCAPGILMAPVASVIVACNAGHSNPEPLFVRWTRGLAPRTVRDIIFGIGINQLSAECASRVPSADALVRETAGSLLAGTLAGYVSHFPHNLSQLKLLDPHTSYADHLRTQLAEGVRRLPTALRHALAGCHPQTLRRAGALYAVLWPTAVLTRAAQIAGSFCIINGFVKLVSQHRLL